MSFDSLVNNVSSLNDTPSNQVVNEEPTSTHEVIPTILEVAIIAIKEVCNASAEAGFGGVQPYKLFAMPNVRLRLTQVASTGTFELPANLNYWSIFEALEKQGLIRMFQNKKRNWCVVTKEHDTYTPQAKAEKALADLPKEFHHLVKK